MGDLSSKVDFLEARLTLLERRIEALTSGDANVTPITGRRLLPCTQPGLIIARAYALEHTEVGEPFCWVGNDGPLQFLLPVAVRQSAPCRMILLPHPAVDFSRVEVIANDTRVPAAARALNGDKLSLEFEVPGTAAPHLNISLQNVASRRPCDLGENTDTRLLSARFFAIEIGAD